MSLASLIGRRVVVTFTDPWDFVTENGAEAAGKIIAAPSERELAIELDRAVSSDGKSSRALMARPRHRGVELGALQVGAEILCHLTATGGGESPFAAGATGLFSLIGSLKL